MKKLILISLLSILSSFSVLSLNKTALVIGNQNYSNMSKLTTPKNEAIQMKDALERLGFEVIIILDGTEDGILDALYKFEDLLKERGGLALFHYGGHGIQVNDSNYIIPVDAKIPDERRVRTNAIDVDEVLGVMEMSGSKTNIVILDACRDNPLPSTSRSSTRGLAVVASQPPDSIIVYSADAGTTAQDGLFTPTLLKYLETPGLEIGEILKKVRRDVRKASGGKQRTGEYNQLESDVYLAGKNNEINNFNDIPNMNKDDFNGEVPKKENNSESTSNKLLYGSLQVSVNEDGIFYLNGKKIKAFTKGKTYKISKLTIGKYKLEYRGRSGVENVETTISENSVSKVVFNNGKNQDLSEFIDMVLIEPGKFKMGSDKGDNNEKPVHNVTLSIGYFIGKHEVTQKQWKEIMGNQPSYFQGGNRPVENVTWYDAIEFCNRLSIKEGLTPVYSGSGKNIFMNIEANGYRLPTEAEWEFAARGGNISQDFKFAGSYFINNVAVYRSNSYEKGKSDKYFGTHNIGTKKSNEIGLFDMSGNVYEWCWDMYDNYSNWDETDPEGGLGSKRVIRGGSWRNNENSSRLTHRSYKPPYTAHDSIGFRIVRSFIF